MKIAIAADHAGYQEKEQLKPLLTELGIQFEDLGTVSPESVDYPDYARKVAEKVARGEADPRYLIGYYPSNKRDDGKRRKVLIEVRDHPDYLLSRRKSYIAPDANNNRAK